MGQGADTLHSDALSRRPIGFVWGLLLHFLMGLGVVGVMQKQPNADPMQRRDGRV